jgi:GxxExxY protein
MTENEIAKIAVDAAYKIHKHFGPGLHESVYEACLLYELRKRGLKAERQVAVGLRYETITFDEAFRADIIVEGKVILEIKAVEEIRRIHKKQLLTYLRLTDTRLGLVINFDSEYIRDGLARVVNGLQDDGEQA